MPSALRKDWQKLKTTLPAGSDKLFKQDLGPNLDSAQDAYDAFKATNAKTLTIPGFDKPTPDLGHLRSKIAAALPLHDKVVAVAGEYRKVLAKMPKAPAITKADMFLNGVIQAHNTQLADLRAHIPSEADAAKFKTAYMNAQLKKL